jgi:glycosyltransferase involved in cell wall biosynthesis
MSKKIIFHYSILNIGGAEKSTLRLMKLLCDNGWDVSLVVNIKGGKLESHLDKRIKLYALRSFEAGLKFKSAKNLIGKAMALGDLVLYIVTRVEESIKKRLLRFQEFDVAGVSLHGLDASLVCEYIDAKVKLHWIRNDLSGCDPHKKAYNNIQRYQECIDYYICVSQTAYDSFVKLFPNLQHKARVIPNVLQASQMIQSANETSGVYSNYPNKLKVVTVCRLSEKAKGLLRMVKVHQRLRDDGIDFMWFVVGDGEDRDLMQQAINEANLQNNMILLGAKSNPYPYFKEADISATLSYYEGLCGAVNEAKILGKVVIATEFSGIYEQIVNEQSGLIVKNSEDAIYEGMKRLLLDSELREKLSNDDLAPKIKDDKLKLKMLEDLLHSKVNK